MSLLVKICGLRTAADVAAAVDAGADAIGFVFAESKRRVTPAEASAAAADAPAKVTRVAVMLHPSNDEWQAVLEGFAPDVLQTDVEDFASLDVPASVTRWPVIREGNPALDDELLPATFLYEGAKSGQGETVDWTRAADVAARGRMILAGGISAANVVEAVATAKPYGVDVSSAVESAPGRKDPAMIQDFVKAARAAEQTL
ncbi:MAG: phosphoribosylanthranilate isomerase [Woeseiaceae bacterium]|nr:phosphoribosylanthranilate isomerase [Woeseiaceae bacterium]